MAPKRSRQDEAQVTPDSTPPRKIRWARILKNGDYSMSRDGDLSDSADEECTNENIAESASRSIRNSPSSTTQQYANENIAESPSRSIRSSPSATAQPTGSAAATQALATTELLEQILLFVPNVKSVTIMRRVSPQWRAVIDGSNSIKQRVLSLKQRMWLAPQQLDHEWFLSPGATKLRKRPTTTAARRDPGDIIYKSAILDQNLLRKAKDSDSERPIRKSYYHNSWVSQPLFVPGPSPPWDVTRTDPWKMKGLYLKTFATQPSVPVMYLVIQGALDITYSCQIEPIKNKKGVTVGDVLKAVRGVRYWCDRPTFIVVENVMFLAESATEISIEEPFPEAGLFH